MIDHRINPKWLGRTDPRVSSSPTPYVVDSFRFLFCVRNAGMEVRYETLRYYGLKLITRGL